MLGRIAWGLLGASVLALALIGETSGRALSAYGVGSLLMVALAAGAAGGALNGSLAPRRREFLVPAGLLIGALFLAAWRAPEPWSGRLTLLEWGMGVGVAAVLAVWASPERASGVCAWVLSAGAALALYALYQRGWGLESLRRACAAQPGLTGLPANASAYAKEALASRLGSSEPFGTFAISNTLAGLMLLCAPLAAGLAWDRWKEGFRLKALVLVVLAAAGAGVILLTGSKGAWVAAGLVAAGWAWWKAAGRNRLIVGSLIGLGGAWLVWRMGSPGSLGGSTHFRLGYWVGAARMVLEHPWGGMGLGGFALEYNRYRPVWARDVMRAHCEPLQLWAEAGIWALAGAAWLAGLCWARGRSVSPVGRERGPEEASLLRPAVIGLAVLALPVALPSILPTAFLFAPINAPWYRSALGIVLVSGMALAAGLVAWACGGGLGPAGRLGALAGTLMLGVHALGDFDLSVPGVAVAGWSVLGMLAAQAPGGTRASGSMGRWLVAGAALLAAGGFVLAMAQPALSFDTAVEQAKREPDGYDRLARTVPVMPASGEAWELLGEAAEKRGLMDASLSARAAAARLMPGNCRVRWDLSRIYLARSAKDPASADPAVQWADAAVRACPVSPLARMVAAGARRRLGREAEAARLAREALDLDDAVEEPNLRLSDDQRSAARAWASRP